MARQDFVDQLTAMGYVVEDLGQGHLAFEYLVDVGKFIGEKLKMGFDVKDDFPMNPPSGPHISPKLLPLNPASGVHPLAGVHASPFGDQWEYWSRPFVGWAETDRTVRTYMRHIRKLFDTQ